MNEKVIFSLLQTRKFIVSEFTTVNFSEVRQDRKNTP